LTDFTDTIVGEDFEVVVRGSQRPYLVVLKGAHVGHTFCVDSPSMVIGRDESVDIALLDGRISRRHARVITDEDGCSIEDLGSRNGCFVNGDRVAGTRRLQDGDKIHLGSTCVLKLTYQDELDENFQREMLESALCDPLTGAYNRRFFLDRLEGEFRFAKRHEVAMSIVMIDVDHFKEVNDTHGHVVGDAVLADVANTIRPSIRGEDVFARYGGEEFVLLCRASDSEQCRVVAERIRTRIAERALDVSGGKVRVTVSLGIASLPDIAADSPMQLIAAADAALYAAKAAGRNRTQVAEQPSDGAATV
jgi:diguanylate cyclase (GGDEF)-like protein